jgi:hypothetical protein
MRQIPPTDRIPLFMLETLYQQYCQWYPHPPQAQTLGDMEEISAWYSRLREWRQQQAEQILQMKPGWSSPLLLDNAVAVSCTLLGFLRGNAFQEICSWPQGHESEVLDLQMPMSHDAIVVDDVPYADACTAKALLVDALRGDGMASSRQILLRHDYRVTFEEDRVSFLSVAQPSVTYRVSSQKPSSQEWWWYSR